MLYYKTKKLAFYMPPRTGTTTFSSLLRQWGAVISDRKHAKPNEIDSSTFVDYTFYGFYRDPLERFLSLLRHMQQKYSAQENVVAAMGISTEDIKTLTYDQLVDFFPTYEKVSTFYYSPQVEWLSNAEVLDFKKYNQEVLRVARMFDVNKVHLGTLNASVNTGLVPSQKVIDFVQTYYLDDYRFGRDRGLLA